MKNFFLIILILLFNNISFGKQQSDSINLKRIEQKFEILEDQLKEVRRDELNYKLEKDLLKETYENNFNNISLIITFILGIFGILGFVGIRDINSIKREYMSELTNLKNLQNEIATKFKEFDTSKEKYDNELREILQTNEEQNKKIKVLELKEKISSLIKEKEYFSALEFCNVALELSNEDTFLLNQKASINARMRNYKDSVSIYSKLLEKDSTNNVIIYNLSEVLLLNRQREDYEKIIEEHKEMFSKKIDGKLLEIYSIVIAYQDKQIDKLKEYSISKIDIADLKTKRRKIDNWDFLDILLYLGNEPYSQETLIAQNIIWFLDGQISGNDFFKRTGIESPYEQAEKEEI
ncbi:hypothetical protein MW871_15830 [Flavobacterium sp. I-SCBP12n]|uniref:Tetratricopeptide repeat protein n=1 Tax=Flavobacterium pygoscelis TaxID=2893176 RepID=A0A9X1XV94_9FLAO|nr:hypothetical protein [Flavobacterium pygoscelis]MCK8143361.1 hypothetical protein [Flavobacterium pygoscelis]